jgi:hypothetical protein
MLCCRPREGGDPYAVTYQRSCGVWIPGLADARPGREDKQSGNDSGEMERKVLRSFPSPDCAGTSGELAISRHVVRRHGRGEPGHDNEERYCRNQLLNGRLSRRRSLAG